MTDTHPQYAPVAPYLMVHDANAAIEHYKAAFGAEVTERYDQDGKVGHANLRINGDEFRQLIHSLAPHRAVLLEPRVELAQRVAVKLVEGPMTPPFPALSWWATLPSKASVTVSKPLCGLIRTACGKVVEFQLEAIEVLQNDVAEKFGFELTGHGFAFSRGDGQAAAP